MKKMLRAFLCVMLGFSMFAGFMSCESEVKYKTVEKEVEVEKKVYTCPTCGTEYENAFEATNCFARHQPVADTTAPANVTNLEAINLDGAVALKWTDPEDEDLFGIQIKFTPKTYAASRAVAPMESGSIFVAPGTEIAEISNLVNGIEYTFVLLPMDIYGNKANGWRISITPEEIEGSVLAITLTPDTTAATNQDVSVSIAVTTESNRSVKTIKMATGSKELEYFETEGTEVSSSFTVRENGIYTVYAQDIDGRVGLKKIVVSNIDKTAPNEVTSLNAVYSFTAKTLTLNWINPSASDFDHCVVNASYGSNNVVVDESVTGTSLVIDNINADNSSEFTASVVALDVLGNRSEAASITTVPMSGAYVSSLVLDKYHVSGTASDADRTINVTAVISNKDLLTNPIPVQIQLMDINNSKVAESTTYDSATGTATASFVIPKNSSATREGVNYTVRVKLDGTTDNKTARVNVSKAPELSYVEGVTDYYDYSSKWTPKFYLLTKDSEESDFDLKTNKMQKAYADLTSSSMIDVQLKGYNLDASPVVLQYYTLNNIAYGDPIIVDTSTFAWTAAEGNHEEKTVNFTIPYPQNEGIYRLKILVEGKIFNASSQINWKEQGSSSYGGTIEVYNTIHVYGIPKFTSFKIPVAGIAKEDYKMETKIKGVNFAAPGVTANDFKITCINNSVLDGAYVTVVDDNTLKVFLNIPGTAGVYPVTIRAGGNVITENFEVKDYTGIEIGDYILKDGTNLSKDTELTDSQKEKIVAVAGCFDIYGAMCGLGLNQSSSSLKLITNASYDIPYGEIVADVSSNPTTITGDTYGSDNWEYLKTVDPENTEKAESEYPAFYFALNYGTTSGLEGDLANGWFIPSIYELYELSKNITTINDSLYKVNGKKLTYYYWSSSKAGSLKAYEIYIDNGRINDGYCNYGGKVLCIRVF